MKGITKAFARTPHQFTTRIGMAKKTTDPEFDDYHRKFEVIEQGAEKILKDSKVFRDAVQTLLTSGSTFATSFTTLFGPIGSGEYDLTSRHPQAEVTVNNIGQYQQLMEDLRETLAPELELIESRVIAPSIELQDICKRIRKTITKRDHKLIDYDRHNNSLNKLREKKEKSLSDEKNLFKVEQDFEIASGEYEHWNNLLKQELPAFLQMAAAFSDPIFHSFYYMQLNILYLMQDKIQSFADGKYDVTNKDIEGIYFSQRGDAADQIEALTITKRLVSTAKLMSGHRSASGSIAGRSPLDRKTSLNSTSSAGLGRQPSYSAGTAAKYNLPPPVHGASSAAVAAPPPYTAGTTGLASTSGSIKKAPPPPPPMKRAASAAPQPEICVALFDFAPQADGDLGFKAGDRIEIIERSETQDDWWTGRLNSVTGVFPGSYTQLQG
ncbi:BAR adaptor protein Hob1 [Naganishia albida]|nr:BAR adaptor protein Hob1 [Naganishia albida]